MLFLMRANVVSLLEILCDHLVAVLLIGVCLVQAPDVGSVGAVCPPTPLQKIIEYNDALGLVPHPNILLQ